MNKADIPSPDGYRPTTFKTVTTVNAPPEKVMLAIYGILNLEIYSLQ